MSDGSDERTLPASPRRRAEAWQSGSTPRSSALTSAVVLLAVLLYMALFGGAVVTRCGRWLRTSLTDVGVAAVQPDDLVASVQSSLWSGVMLLTGVVSTALTTALAAEWLQSGGRFSPGSAAPQPDRLTQDGARRIWRGIWSAGPWGEAVRWLLPLALLLVLLIDQWPRLLGLMSAGPVEMARLAGELALRLLGRLCAAMVLLGLLNYAWQRWCWERSLRMTPAEQREEQRLDRRRIR